MKIHLLFVATIVAVSITAIRAESPKSQVVILDDGSLIEGVVERFEGVVRITPSKGSAKLATAQQIAFIGDSRDAAYQFAISKVDTQSLDGARQLADWCEKVGMRDQAMRHAKAALALSPDNKLLKEQIVRLNSTVSAFPSVGKTVIQEKAITPAMVELASGAAVTFAAKVQPILTNQCAVCHAADDYSGTFHLNRITPGYSNPEATAANLKVVRSHLNPEDSLTSPLLTYALALHGGQKRAAFVNREQPAFQNLQNWVLTALPPRNNERNLVRGFGTIVTEPTTPEPRSLPGAVVGTVGKPAPQSVAIPVVVTPPPQVPVTAKAAAPANPGDPFDPAIFNSKRSSGQK